jgi:hypothetical protein
MPGPGGPVAIGPDSFAAVKRKPRPADSLTEAPRVDYFGSSPKLKLIV